LAFDPFEELGRHASRHTRCNHAPIDRPAQITQEADYWAKVIKTCDERSRLEHYRFLAKNDLYFLLNHILGIPHIHTQWHLERCVEVQQDHDGIFDAWSRGSSKSVTKTYGLVIQKILNDPDVCICILSHVRPIAKDFLRKIKTTFESHTFLRSLFPDVLWENCNQAPVWSLDHGITVKRKSVTRGEATVEAFGLVDGQPTGHHYNFLVFDDIQKEKVSDYAIGQIDEAFQTAMGLGSTKPTHFTVSGVFFRGGSVYESMIDRGVVKPRVRPAIFPNGTSPIWTDEQVRATIKLVSPGVLACEYLMDPTKKVEGEGFQEAWLRYYDSSIDLPSSYVYMVVDPGRGSHKTLGSKTAIGVIATRADGKYYLIDGVFAPMGLIQRNQWVLALHRQYHPRKILYEHFGLAGDIESLRDRAKREGYQPETGMEIFPCSAHVDKQDRIAWLGPICSEGRFVIPKSLPTRVINEEESNFLTEFLTEYRNYPATRYLDVLDSLAWMFWKENGVMFPTGYESEATKVKTLDFNESEITGGWMSS
jgi:hypothetical protein